VTIRNVDALARFARDSFHINLILRKGREPLRLEHYDVSALWPAREICEALHKDMVAWSNCGLHRASRNGERSQQSKKTEAHKSREHDCRNTCEGDETFLPPFQPDARAPGRK